MQSHQYANLFPMMTDAELQTLIDDMKANGYDNSAPIITYQGFILDGRNRYRAATEASIIPPFVEYDGNDPLEYVLRHNLHRRHLNETQRAGVAAKLANMPRGRNWDNSANLQNKKLDILQAAEMLNVSPRTIATVKSVEKASPELAQKMQSGEITAHEASKQIKKQSRTNDINKQREEIKSGTSTLPKGLFEVISFDPPWPYGTEYDPNGRRAANPYPEMSLEQIAQINIPASENCILWLWTTHKFMRNSFSLLDGWGFRDVMIVTWVKDRMGLGTWLRSQSEFCIMAVKGKPIIDLTNQTTVINGKLREHSRKPDEFYSMVDSLCVGRKLDYFSREEREGWEQFGNDISKF